MSLRTQAKVLRSLEEQRFEPVGGPAACRWTSAWSPPPNKNLEEEIEHGNFREDLFYRLNVIPSPCRPARPPRGIPLLADFFSASSPPPTAVSPRN